MITQTKLIKLILPFETMLMTLYNHHLIIDGNTYSASVLRDDIRLETSASLQADMAIISIIKIYQHQYNGGDLEIYDYDLQTKQIILPACFVGKIMATEINDTTITLKAYSAKRLLNKIITRTYNRHCQAEWGDNRCQINKENYKQHIEITDISINNIFYNVLSGHIEKFYNPYIQDSLGNIITVLNLDINSQKFQTEAQYTLKPRQTYMLYAGCHNNIINCRAYNNSNHYLGFL